MLYVLSAYCAVTLVITLMICYGEHCWSWFRRASAAARCFYASNYASNFACRRVNRECCSARSNCGMLDDGSCRNIRERPVASQVTSFYVYKD